MASQQPPKFASPPPETPNFLLTYPLPHILLVTINRPRAANCLTYAMSWEADALFRWYDSEPSLRAAVITGAGKAFCAGQDVAEQGMNVMLWQQKKAGEEVDLPEVQNSVFPSNGFAGISRRYGKKPIVAAVNGVAMGGGFELVLGSDMIIASPKSLFGLPEVIVGIYAATGGLSRLVRQCGMAVASEIAMAGRNLSAAEALSFGLINRVAASPESVVDEALALASKIAAASPDSIIVTRMGLRESWEEASVERATQNLDNRYKERMFDAQNTMVGIRAFAAKKKPEWLPSKL